MDPNLLLIINVAATWYMVGLIWMVQIVHYPLFSKVGGEDYETYQTLHQKLTSVVVGPPMLIEAFSSVFLATYRPIGISLAEVVIGIALIFVIWLSTLLLQIPCHGKLNLGFDAKVHRRLVGSNWIRTVGWTMRGVLSGWMLWKVMTA